MSGSDLCKPRNETAWPSYFRNRIIMVPSPIFHIHVSVSDLYIPRIGLPILHECRNWDRGCAVSFLGIYDLEFWYSVVHARFFNSVEQCVKEIC
jgi:hypothetical protein